MQDNDDWKFWMLYWILDEQKQDRVYSDREQTPEERLRLKKFRRNTRILMGIVLAFFVGAIIYVFSL